MPNKPHIHAEVIKAWADGADIEWRAPGADNEWHDARDPQWVTTCEYRIKPPVKTYGEIAKEAWYGDDPLECRIDRRHLRWAKVADEIIAAYKEREE